MGQESIGAMVRKEDRRLIGSLGIIRLQTQNPPVLALGYWLDEAAWSKGYTTEAIKAWQRK